MTRSPTTRTSRAATTRIGLVLGVVLALAWPASEAAANAVASLSTLCNGIPNSDQDMGAAAASAGTQVSYGPGGANMGRVQVASSVITTSSPSSLPTLSGSAAVTVGSPPGAACTMTGFAVATQEWLAVSDIPGDTRMVPYRLLLELDGSLSATKAGEGEAAVGVQAVLFDAVGIPVLNLGELVISASAGLESVSGFSFGTGLVQDASTDDDFIRLIDGSIVAIFPAPANTQLFPRVVLLVGADDPGGGSLGLTTTSVFGNTLTFDLVSLDPNVTVTAVVIPEPTTGVLIAAGIAGVVVWARRRKGSARRT